MKELRRRQAEATARRVPPGARPPGDDDEDAGEDPPDDPDADPDGPADIRAIGDDPGADATDDDDSTREPRPIPLRRPGGRRASPGGPTGNGDGRPPTRGSRTRVGGPRDGSFSIRSRLTTIVVVALVIFVVLMFAVGINLWTDAIWYRSVGFDQVFWTRLGVQAGLFGLGAVVALVVLFANLWLAGRLSPE